MDDHVIYGIFVTHVCGLFDEYICMYEVFIFVKRIREDKTKNIIKSISRNDNNRIASITICFSR